MMIDSANLSYISKESVPMKLHGFGVDSVIVGDTNTTALNMADRCLVHGPPGTLFDGAKRIVKWPNGHRTFVFAKIDARKIRGLSVGAVWAGNINHVDNVFDTVLLALREDPREVILSRGHM